MAAFSLASLDIWGVVDSELGRLEVVAGRGEEDEDVDVDVDVDVVVGVDAGVGTAE
jgi:hypothetical protein